MPAKGIIEAATAFARGAAVMRRRSMPISGDRGASIIAARRIWARATDGLMSPGAAHTLMFLPHFKCVILYGT